MQRLRPQDVLDSLAAHIAVLDEAGVIAAVNRPWRDFATANGVAPAIVCEGANYLQVCDEASGQGAEAASAVARGIRDVLAGRCVEFLQEYPCHAPGRERWFVVRVTRLNVEGPPRAIVSHEDVTEQKQAERALRESEENFRLLLDSTGEAIYGLDLDGRCTFCNAACLRLLGYADVARSAREEYALADSPQPSRRVNSYSLEECRIFQAFRKGEGTHVEDEVLWRADGTSFPVEYWSYPVRKGEQVGGAVVTFVDISERRRVEEELRILNAALESAVECIARLDTRGHYLSVNSAYAEMLGYRPEDLIGLDAEQTVHPGDCGALMAAARRKMEAEGRAEVEVLALRKDGSTFWAQAVMVQTRDRRGGWTGNYRFMKDITGRKRAEEELRGYAARSQVLSRRIVEVQEEERRHLARELHDEIGQTLTAISINLHAVKRACGEGQQARLEESIGIVDGAIQQVRNLSLDLRPSMLDDLGLVATLRWFLDRQAQRVGYRARLVAGPHPIELGPAETTAAFRVVQEALTNVARHARARHVRAHAAAPGSGPACDHPRRWRRLRSGGSVPRTARRHGARTAGHARAGGPARRPADRPLGTRSGNRGPAVPPGPAGRRGGLNMGAIRVLLADDHGLVRRRDPLLARGTGGHRDRRRGE